MELSHFQARRKQVFEKMKDNSVALLTGAPIQHRNSDTEYNFRQDSYFFYLTGFNESFVIAALVKKQGECRFILFCQDRELAAEQWTGPRIGVQGAREFYGADEAYSVTQMQGKFVDIVNGVQHVYYLINNHPAFDKKLFSWVDSLRKKARQGIEVPHQFLDFRVILDEMRLIKTPEEIRAIQAACDNTAAGHIAAMQACKPGMMEYEIEAILLHEFTRRGSRACAYPSIVAGGQNACILHYTQNNAVLEDNQLLLIDAGAEFEYYAADVTRTFPVNGKFSGPQKAIYELVLSAQTAAINAVKVGILWTELQQIIVEILVAGLVDLKILRGNVKDLIEQKAYRPFYMHNSGHWLGLDVHDVGDYKIGGSWRKLAPNMVFTIEPGLYFSPDLPHLPEQWRGIGVRIEDDILVTDKGGEVLTKAIPKSIIEMEK